MYALGKIYAAQRHPARQKDTKGWRDPPLNLHCLSRSSQVSSDAYLRYNFRFTLSNSESQTYPRETLEFPSLLNCAYLRIGEILRSLKGTKIQPLYLFSLCTPPSILSLHPENIL